jgi:hypothetical protein
MRVKWIISGTVLAAAAYAIVAGLLLLPHRVEAGSGQDPINKKLDQILEKLDRIEKQLHQRGVMIPSQVVPRVVPAPVPPKRVDPLEVPAVPLAK